tara:strand:- start:463 stop:639 length:177 start_codon:yes stop_codon:yes gene_type:complete
MAKAGHLHDVMYSQLMPHYLANATQHPDIIQLCWQMAANLGTDAFLRQPIALRAYTGK